MANMIRRLLATFASVHKPIESPPKRKSGSEKGRVNQQWNKTPERRFLKCVLGHLIRTGLARSELLPEFKRLIPDFQLFFDTPVSDNALWGRADTGRRGGKYANENPNVHPLTRPYWEPARKIVQDGIPLTAVDVRRIAREVGDEAANIEPPAALLNVEHKGPAHADLLPDNAQWTNRFQIKSESSSRLYVVAQRKSDGTWACSCPGWKANRRCKHLRTLQPHLKGKQHASFSDAAYKHYDPSVSGYGSPDEWERIAAALFGATHDTGDKDQLYLARLGLDRLPPSLADLTKAFRSTMFRAHPDYGGTNQAAREAMEAYELLKGQFNSV